MKIPPIREPRAMNREDLQRVKYLGRTHYVMGISYGGRYKWGKYYDLMPINGIWPIMSIHESKISPCPEESDAVFYSATQTGAAMPRLVVENA